MKKEKKRTTNGFQWVKYDEYVEYVGMEGKEFFESFFFCFRCEDDELINGQQV
jgi:hypothetical protein